MDKNNDSPTRGKEKIDKENSEKKADKKTGSSSNLHDGHRRRMFNKYYTNGIDSLEEHEILEIALYSIFPRCNTNEISHDLLNSFSTILGVFSASVEDLCCVKNIGKDTAIKIKFLGDLLKHTSVQVPNIVRFSCTKDIVGYCKSFTDRENREILLLLFLDQNNVLISQRICAGSSDTVNVDNMHIIKYISETNCKKLVMVHKHLNDQLNASDSDVKSTRRLMDLLDHLNITLLDHIIMGTNDNYHSFHESNVIEGL